MTTMLAIGLMSGTSLDGIDAALIETDGRDVVRPRAFVGIDYSDADRALLVEATRLALLQRSRVRLPEIEAAEALLTDRHAAAVAALLSQANIAASDVAVIGYHGQTVAHRPDDRWTWQLSDGAALARMTGIDTVADFRSADVAAGGQGAPLLPVYHAALASGLALPVAVLNLGGVANITFIGRGGALVAFDTGPANGLIDDWVGAVAGKRYDAGGAMAATGTVDEGLLATMLDHPFFDQPPPKSLDRSDFTIQPVRGLSPADGAATLTAFTAATVAHALRHLPERPRRLFLAGGGRHNAAMTAMLSERTGIPVEPAEAIGVNGDAVEAEGFAYMAVRHLAGLPISFLGTTGVPAPMAGGTLHRAR